MGNTHYKAEEFRALRRYYQQSGILGLPRSAT